MECTREIRADRRLPIFNRELRDGRESANSGVVDKYVQPAERSVCGREELPNRFMILYIGNFAADFTWTYPAQIHHRLFHCFRSAAANHHARALAQQHV